MTDHTESKVRQWAKVRNGDPLTNKDVVELVLAVDDDGTARHRESVKILEDHGRRIGTLEQSVKLMEDCAEQERRPRYTREQVVTAILIVAATVAGNTFISWLVVRTLEAAK